MAIPCIAACAVNVPSFVGANCNKITTRKGGISRVGLLTCDYVFTDITDPLEWAAAQTANDVHLLPIGIGSKPETSKTNLKLAACEPEQLVGETHTLPFRTYQTDGTALTDFAAHNTARQNMGAFRLFWIGCDGLFYFHPDYATENAGFKATYTKWDYVVPEDSKEPAMYDIEFQFDFEGIVPGVELPLVLEALG